MERTEIEERLIKKGYIPLGKSWLIRMGVLDLWNGRDDIIKFLERRENELSDDLLAMLRVARAWRAGERDLDVGESAKLLRTMRFMAWKLGIDKRFIRRGSLLKRRISNNPEIINYPLEKLRKLDDEPAETSQWMSAAVLLGNKEKIDNPPFHLRLTYEALKHWEKQRKEGNPWEARHDKTILNQAIAYLELFRGGKISSIPEQQEDYCFFRIFGFITKEEGELRWPSLRGHESDRIKEMERVIKDINKRKEIKSKDHRVVQAGAMYRNLRNMPLRVKYPGSVNKSWPRSQFEKFLNDAPSLSLSLKWKGYL